MQSVIPKLKYCEDPDNETDRLSFLEFNKLKLIDTVLLIWDKQLYQSSQFDKQAICEELKKRLSDTFRNHALLFSGLSYSCCKLYSFRLLSLWTHTTGINQPLKKYRSIYRLIFIKTASICSFLLKKPSTSLQMLASCATPRSKDCQRKKVPAASKDAVHSSEFKLIGTVFFWQLFKMNA